MNQIAKTFVLVGLVVIMLLLMHLLPPMSIGNTPLRSVDILSDVFKEESENEQHANEAKPEKTLPKGKGEGGREAFKDSIPAGVTPIEDFSEGKAGGMNSFYTILEKSKQLGRPVRIAYFGDSFIEGDIYTCDLREMLQAEYGGYGPGWIDAGSALNKGFRRTIIQHVNGIREHLVVKHPFNSRVQGLNQRYYIPEEGARLATETTQLMPHANRWQVARLFFRSDGLTITSQIKGKAATTKTFGSSDRLQMLESRGETEGISYSFSNISSDTYLYGMSLESEQGIILDNYSMRGSAGYTLANIPSSTLSDFAHMRPLDLIILHFGLNVVNEKSRINELKTYCKRMQKAVNVLRTAFPSAAILVMGVPDRSQRTADGITTMPNIKLMIDCQREMASTCKVAFYNLFEAMGGKGSMKRLVEQGYANKDYTHINPKGGKVIARHVFESLRNGYENYLRRKANQHE
ncbi:MAG: hypothetical protein SPI30_07275 [Prevotella sp.]|nr:hypothetical protein [Prevotella sp.]